jgi:hypothetical protein
MHGRLAFRGLVADAQRRPACPVGKPDRRLRRYLLPVCQHEAPFKPISVTRQYTATAFSDGKVKTESARQPISQRRSKTGPMDGCEGGTLSAFGDCVGFESRYIVLSTWSTAAFNF